MEDETHRGAGEVFARRLREVRALHGMSARALSERLAEMGVTMGRDAIAKLENYPARAATVRLETVLAISAALNCSPSWMITPDEQDEYVCIAPGLCQPAGAVRLWLRGDFPLGGADPEDFFMLMPAAEHKERLKVGRARRASVAVIEAMEREAGHGLEDAEIAKRLTERLTENQIAKRSEIPEAQVKRQRETSAADFYAKEKGQ